MLKALCVMFKMNKNLLLLGFVAVQVDAIECGERMLELSTPKLSTSIDIQHTLIREGPCTIAIEYSLSADGEVRDMVPSHKEERCKGLARSAVFALRESQFSKGASVDGCEQKFTYAIE